MTSACPRGPRRRENHETPRLSPHHRRARHRCGLATASRQPPTVDPLTKPTRIAIVSRADRVFIHRPPHGNSAPVAPQVNRMDLEVNMSHAPNIAVLVELSNSHARGLIRGVSRYAQTHGPWKLHLLEHLRPKDIHRCLRTWQCAGLIAKVKTPAIAQQLCETDIPVVNVSGTTTIGRWRRVDTDDSAVCWMAVSHLLDRGYRSFGFCGMPRYEWSRRRPGFMRLNSLGVK